MLTMNGHGWAARLCLGALVGAACAPDVVGPGYEEPDPAIIGAGGAASAPFGGNGGLPPATSDTGGASSIPPAAGGSSVASGGRPQTVSTGAARRAPTAT